MLQSNTLRRSTLAVLAATLSVGMVACNGTKTPTATVTGVTIAPTTASVAVNATTTLKATVTGTNNPAQTVTWKSSSDAIAMVSAAGVVTGKTAGKATITACSTLASTKCGTAEVTVTAGTGGTTLTPAVNINFQPSSTTTTPSGYVANTGAAYTAATMTGWVTEASVGTATPVALNMSNNMRDRNASTSKVAGAAPEQYTQANMQCGPATDGRTCSGGATQTPGAFQYKVVNGTYTVTISIGESVTTDFNAKMNLNVEGVALATGFVPTAAQPFSILVKDVKVTDGMLTVDAKGGVNTKIQYLKIAPAAVQQ